MAFYIPKRKLIHKIKQLELTNQMLIPVSGKPNHYEIGPKKENNINKNYKFMLDHSSEN